MAFQLTLTTRLIYTGFPEFKEEWIPKKGEQNDWILFLLADFVNHKTSLRWWHFLPQMKRIILREYYAAFFSQINI